MRIVNTNEVEPSFYYPDSGKWGVQMPERRMMRAEALDYFDREE